MTDERMWPRDDAQGSCGNGPAGGGNLESLRRRADQFTEIARRANARIEARGEAQQQLDNVRNEGGQ